MRGGPSDIRGGRQEPGRQAPFSPSPGGPKVSPGPSSPPFIGDASREAVPQARVRRDSPLGPARPTCEPTSRTVRKPARELTARFGPSRCARSGRRILGWPTAVRANFLQRTPEQALPQAVRQESPNVRTGSRCAGGGVGFKYQDRMQQAVTQDCPGVYWSFRLTCRTDPCNIIMVKKTATRLTSSLASRCAVHSPQHVALRRLRGSTMKRKDPHG